IRKRHAELERELRSDLELEEEEQQEIGLSSEEARYAARRAFGNVTLIKEQTHEAWGWARIERLLQDLRYAMRQLRRSPGYAITAIASMALGIAATAAVFSVLYGVLIDPYPYRNADRIAMIYLQDNQGYAGPMSFLLADIQELRKARSVASVFAQH